MLCAFDEGVGGREEAGQANAHVEEGSKGYSNVANEALTGFELFVELLLQGLAGGQQLDVVRAFEIAQDELSRGGGQVL